MGQSGQFTLKIQWIGNLVIVGRQPPLAYPIVGRQAYPIVGHQPLHWHTLLWVGMHTQLWVIRSIYIEAPVGRQAYPIVGRQPLATSKNPIVGWHQHTLVWVGSLSTSNTQSWVISLKH